MKLHEMRPEECRKAITENWPLFLPLGTIEYHGEHLPLGVDTTIVIKILDRIEKKIDCIIAPPIYFGLSSYAVSGPEKGTIDINPDFFEKYIYDILNGFLENGYRKILVVIHHQFEGEQLMPMATAAKKAALSVIFKYLESSLGRGWWGTKSLENYYNKLKSNKNPFNWIRIIPLMNNEIQKRFGYDHAGKVETSLMLSLDKNTVKMEKLDKDGLWFTGDAKEANHLYGEKVANMIIEYLIREAKNE